MERKTDLAEISFPVELRNVYMDVPNSPSKIRVPRYKAVVNVDTDEPFAIVTEDYRLVTNDEALQLARQCFALVFSPKGSDRMETFNIITPSTRSFCHVDLIHQTYRVNIWHKEVWLPYIRVTNSYNRTKTLRFDLGFCRKLCNNGVIFESQTIGFKFYHTKRQIAPIVSFDIEPNKLETCEKEFREYMDVLENFPVPPEWALPIACKALAMRFNIDDLDLKKRHKERQRLQEFRTNTRDLTDRYFGEMGANAYAILNIVSDVASNPVAHTVSSAMIDPLQKRVGTWIEDFSQAICSPEFSFVKYLGGYLQYAG